MNNSVKVIEEVILDCAIITLRSDKIIHIHNLLNGPMSLEISKKIVNARSRLAKNKPYPMLYTSENPTVTASEELTEYLLTEERNRLVLADAFVITSFSQRLAAKMYFNLKKPVKPTSFFPNEVQAVKWLRKFVD